MRIHYPGPAVEGAARHGAHYYGAFGVSLKPGLNEIEDAIAERLIDGGQAIRDEAPPVVEARPRRRRSLPVTEEEGEE